MPRKNSLSRKDIARMSALRPRRAHGRLFSLSFALDPEGIEPKAACVVSKKISTRAVKRNILRRRWREVLRPRLPALPKGTILLFYAKKEAAGASYADIESDVIGLMGRIS